MHALSPREVLCLWEWGQDRHPLERALGFLAVAYPDASWEELVHLNIGQRDARLLTLRELTLGPRLQGFDECPRCGERLEFALAVADFRSPARVDGEERRLEVEGFEVHFRLPNSLDLATVARYEDPAKAHHRLLRNCILEVRYGEESVEVDGLPESVHAALAYRMEEVESQADLRLELTCSECESVWFVLLDIASFFWGEISVLAKRLLRDVHNLARAYGWREADILAMSAVRRGFYLEIVAG
jgi:hypothetical protein